MTDVLVEKIDVELVQGVVQVAGRGLADVTIRWEPGGAPGTATVDLAGDRFDDVPIRANTQMTPVEGVLEQAVRAALIDPEGDEEPVAPVGTVEGDRPTE